jgi:hypothetical protein
MPRQWVASCLQWAAGEQMCHPLPRRPNFDNDPIRVVASDGTLQKIPGNSHCVEEFGSKRPSFADAVRHFVQMDSAQSARENMRCFLTRRLLPKWATASRLHRAAGGEKMCHLPLLPFSRPTSNRSTRTGRGSRSSAGGSPPRSSTSRRRGAFMMFQTVPRRREGSSKHPILLMMIV